MNKTKIEYADYTWNPLIGCKHGCWYCYAERMNRRFKWIEDWKKPVYFKDRLNEPSNIEKPARILVCSMADLFGDWVDASFIGKVIEQTRFYINSQHTFLFLTKNPKRYAEFEFPENCWLGTTVEDSGQIYRLDILKGLQTNNLKFVSFEPLLGDMLELDLHDGIDWGIIGGLTPYKKMEGIYHGIENVLEQTGKWRIPVFMKDNLKPYWDGEWRGELP